MDTFPPSESSGGTISHHSSSFWMPPTVIQRSNVIVSRSQSQHFSAIQSDKDVKLVGHLEPEAPADAPHNGTSEGYPWLISEKGVTVQLPSMSSASLKPETDKQNATKSLGLRSPSECLGKRTLTKGPFTCELCNKSFRHKSYFDYHLRTHTGERPYQCQSCSKSFLERSKLNRHMNSCHNIKSQYDKDILVDKPPNTCPKCGKSLPQSCSLDAHLRSHERVANRRHLCKICGKSFSGWTSLKDHVKGHQGSKNILCEICGKAFLLKKYLDLHLRTTHKQQQRRHKCSRCQKDFHTLKDLKRHQLIHSNDRKFTCQLCRVRFKRRDNLNRHLKLSHSVTPEQPGEDEPPELNDEEGKVKTDSMNLPGGRAKEFGPPTPTAPLPINRRVSVIKSTHEFMMSMSVKKHE